MIFSGSYLFRKIHFVRLTIIALVIAIAYMLMLMTSSTKYVGILYIKIGQVEGAWLEHPKDFINAYILRGINEVSKPVRVHDAEYLDKKAHDLSRIRLEVKGDSEDEVQNYLDEIAYEILQSHEKKYKERLGKFNYIKDIAEEYFSINSDSFISVSSEAAIIKLLECINGKYFDATGLEGLSKRLMDKATLKVLYDKCMEEKPRMTLELVWQANTHHIYMGTFQTTIIGKAVRSGKPSDRAILLFLLMLTMALFTAYMVFDLSIKKSDQ